MTSDRNETRPVEAAAQTPPAMTNPAPLLTSRSIFRGGREATIEHNGEVYRLRITSKDKLILTK